MKAFDFNKINKVFVYGTLKAGRQRAHVLKDCSFVEDDALRGYLFDLGLYPAYIPESSGLTVNGEVYQLPAGRAGEDLLEALDEIEACGMLYYRYAFRTFKGHYAWAYWMPRDRIEHNWAVIRDGVWKLAYNNDVMLLTDLLRSRQDLIWPSKLRSKYHKDVDCLVADLFASGDTLGNQYSSVSMSDSRATAKISFQSIPKINGIGTQIGDSLAEYRRKAAEKKAKEEATKLPPMVDVVWLHSPDESPIPATKQETGGI